MITFRKTTVLDAPKLAQLHVSSLQDGLLYNMGQKYAQIFYKTGLGSQNCFGYIAEANGQTIGAAVSTINIDALFRKMLLTPSFVVGLISRIFKLKKLYPSGGTNIPIKQEFILLFVAPEHRNLTTALTLMKRVDEHYATLGYSKYSLEVKENNPANLLYQRFGFVKTHELGQGNDKRLFYVKHVEDSRDVGDVKHAGDLKHVEDSGNVGEAANGDATGGAL
jgi:GNAT superfamily N-acetyltransferase